MSFVTVNCLDEIILKKLKPNGVVSSEERIFRAMDEEFESESPVIPVQNNKTGSLSARSSVLSQEEFDVVREYVSTKIDELGESIFEGKIAVNTDNCKYCSFESVCGVKSKLSGVDNEIREKVEKSEVIDKMTEANAAHKGRKKE